MFDWLIFRHLSPSPIHITNLIPFAEPAKKRAGEIQSGLMVNESKM